LTRKYSFKHAPPTTTFEYRMNITVPFWTIVVTDNSRVPCFAFMSSDANYDDLYTDAMIAIKMHTTLTDSDEVTDANRKRVERRRRYRDRLTNAKDLLRCGGTFVDSAFCISVAVQKSDVTITTAVPITAEFTTGKLDFIDVPEVRFETDDWTAPSPPSATIIGGKSKKKAQKRKIN
jgi:hypothetical protein